MYGDGSRQWRNPDVMSNVYDSPDRTDRTYGRGGQLREDRKWRYYYDSHGNLVLKTMRRMEPSRNAEVRDELLQWQSGDYAYTWQGNGMLRSVTRPDGKTVTFRYDALGRRIEKVFDGRVYRYLWDGDVILHEWEYAEADRPNTVVTETGEVTLDRPEPVENLITWVYDSAGYVPTAKIVGDKHYSIVSDYIGRPVQAYDDKGNVVWQADYDIYGNLRNLHGSRQFIPFRQLGQYEDEETGLYYNRFRYYDPRIGNYISQDPIRLAGNNPTLYGYVGDLNKRTDIFGLKGGGSYSSVRSSNIGGEVHHTPANSINGLSHGEGPSIWMETTDHRMTSSHGWQGKEGALYRQTQLDLINQGKFADAIQMDIDDIQSSFGSKYDSSINEMLDYSYEKGLISEAERDKMKICTK
ncbi:RHS repeat domain-containing protein [Prevotella fusca]